MALMDFEGSSLGLIEMLSRYLIKFIGGLDKKRKTT
jgi:hypothetical protein